MLDLAAQYKQLQQEIDTAVLQVLKSGHYILGPQVQSFEKEAASYLGVKHSIACANGTEALELALMALGIGAGDEVITTAFTFVASASVISLVGAKPVFVDIEEDSYNIDVNAIEAAITPKTRAIIVVHLYGQAANMDAILAIAQKHDLKVIEDTAQAWGAYSGSSLCGTRGDIGTYSFYPTKNLSCAGDGGMLSTNSDDLAAKLKALRAHGSKQRYYHDDLVRNSRLDEIQAAILRVKLGHIDNWNQARRNIAAKYTELISKLQFQGHNIQCPKTVANDIRSHVFHQYTIRFLNSTLRDAFKEKLQKNNIASEIYYPLSLPLQKIFDDLQYQASDFPQAVKASQTILCLPIYPELDQQRVLEALV